ncbi:DUF4920 domain-containing protein [Algoriphagus sp. C2-6-M1]|uniref:DUF4920 domain-containing protein n=1 Tax=Algoriphagus persicinus TaxID=3108754 RepID=UPI002B37FEB2|nr:DUF4920 domain-containing protein [Algoriphagus sp. C2-6-M1]MEB2779324.1 DUF4920 domain-containing protein [Algoriphagus sp. C2-6-M1]
MKISHLVVLAFGMALSTACQNQKSGTLLEEMGTEVVAADTIPGNYGADMVVAGVVSPSHMISVVEKDGNFEGKIAGEIKEVCTKKGCWLTMDLPNGESMRVTFKDYGFFVPTTSQGYPVILEGVAVLTETDVKTLRHYAEDGGMSKAEVEAITEPKREITFEAVGVVIKDKA